MPKDVALGEGYLGDALFQRFPNQYRDAGDAAGQSYDPANGSVPPVQHYAPGVATVPGNVSGRFVPSDPDRPRELKTINMPGVGQVVVPVEHTMAQVVVPVEHTMACPPPKPGEANAWAAQRLSEAAGHAAKEALDGLRSGALSGLSAVEHYIRKKVGTAAEQVRTTVQERIDFLPGIVDAAVQSGTETIRRMVRDDSWTPGFRPPMPGAPPPAKGKGDWYASMFGLGGITEAVAGITHGEELDRLNSSLRKFHDALSGTYAKLDDLEARDRKVSELEKLPGAWWKIGLASVPSVQGVTIMKGRAAVKEGYRGIVAFHFTAWALVNSMVSAAEAVRKVYPAIDSMLAIWPSFDATIKTRVLNRFPEMKNLWNRLQNEQNVYYGARVGHPLDFNDPRYLEAAALAVQTVTGIKPESGGLSGTGSLGALGPIAAVIVAIAAAIAAVAVVIAVIKIADTWHEKARMLHEQRMTYEKTKEERRKEFFARQRQAGIPEPVIEQQWQAMGARMDEEEKKKQESFAKDTESPFDLGKLAIPAAITVAAIVIGPELVKAIF